TDERQELLLKWGVRQYQITIDGLAEDHDCKRVGRDGSPTHAVILENLRALKRKDENYIVHLRVNFDQENVMGLGTFLEQLSEDFGGDSRFKLRFRAVGKWGGPNDEQLATCGMAEQRQVLRTLRDKAEAMDLRQEGGVLDLARPGSSVCYAARPYSFIIGASGQLMKCTVALYDMPENVVGQIHPDGSLELHDDHMAKWVQPYFESDTKCQKCYLLPTCQGSLCPLTRIKSNVRTCCGTKAELKHEMRFTLVQVERERIYTRQVKERVERRAAAAAAVADAPMLAEAPALVAV
ncbi:MAG TPA: SPASM domain-containing protein, partial [Longimicrobium sp.]